jgi:demethylmenaquinone methyltransferase/2-methoxy-6-polyprenyl-1,4-benzoquinol methylase
LDRRASCESLPPVAGPEKRRYVFRMFQDLAPDYDRWNRLLSFGLDRPWRKKAVAELASCARVCDLGTGTGDMIRALLDNPRFKGQVTAVDPTRELWLKSGQEDLHGEPRCRFALAEGEHLPLSDESCDGIMSGFVMRNFFDLELALSEAARVVKPGSRAIFLEMGHPRNALWRGLFETYFQRVAPAVAGKLAKNPEAYRYLPASLARFPDQPKVCALFRANGWSDSEYKEYLGGAIVAYRATK